MNEEPLNNRERSDHSWRRYALLLVMAVALTIGAMALWGYRILHAPHEHAQAGQIVRIAPGMSAAQILHRLREEGIVPSSWAVTVWFRFMAWTTTFKAGEYAFASPITPAAVIEKLARGEVYLHSVTFPEGLTRFDVARVIERLNIPEASQALQLTEDARLIDLIRDLDPEATTLEGYLFPDTYQYAADTSARQLIANMVKRFREVFTPEYRRRAAELGLTVRQVVTLASMIEREARLDEERPLIASVYHNRLRRGMKLDCDPTVIYAAMLAGAWTGRIRQSDLRRQSPYNTYLHPGLPPGPIASPGRASLEAALYPADTPYLFFVLDPTRDDGAHRFSVTAKQHRAHVAQYRLAERRRAKNRQ